MEVSIIKHNEIFFGERFRKDYGDLDELADSIKRQGLIQPLAVARSEPGAEQLYILLAGGRRFKAIEALEFTDVPVRIYPAGIDSLELRSIELAENFYRKDLEWTEQIQLQREIHELQVAIHGEKISTSPDADGWSLKDTAELVGMSKQSVQKDVHMAKIYSAAPDLFTECDSKADAQKLLKSIGENMLREEMLKRAVATPTASAKKSLLDCYINEDFFTGITKIPDNTINFVELDPPYGIDLKKSKRSDGPVSNTADYNEVDAIEYVVFLDKVLIECYRTMTQHSWMIVWFAPEPWFEQVYSAIISAGFTTNRMCGIWTKPTGQTKWPEKNLGNSYEMFFICRKGDPALIQQGRSNAFEFNPVAGQKKIHPTERPLELMQELLATFCSPGARILVPFLGSGTTLIAASTLSMSGIGFELSKEYRDRYIIRVHKMEELI